MTRLLPLLFLSLSAKPVLAQAALEWGVGGSVGASLTGVHVTEVSVPGLSSDFFRPEAAWEGRFYVGTFPYVGWGWRASLGGAMLTQARDEIRNVGPDVLHYGSARLEVVRVDDAWGEWSLGASVGAVTNVHIGVEGPSTRVYARRYGPIAGIHLGKGWHRAGWSWSVRLDALATVPRGRMREYRNERTTTVGRFLEWRLGPTVELRAPINRRDWLRRLDGPPVIFSPRT